MTTTLIQYSREIAPMIRDLNDAKEVLKEFVETDAQAIKMKEAIKEAQEELAKYLEDHERASNMLRDVKDLTKDIGLAVKAAAKGSAYKPAELKTYFMARAKENGVEKVKEKAELFNDLEIELN